MNYKEVTVFILCVLTLFTYADGACTHKALEGSDVTIHIKPSAIINITDVTWKKDSKIIANKKRGKIVKPGMTENGSLLLINVTLKSAGTYFVDIADAKGVTLELSEELCVYAKVQATVNFTCENNSITLRCDAKGEALLFKWYKNGRAINENASNFTTRMENNDHNYQCTVNNSVQSATSQEVKIKCIVAGKSSIFDVWFMVIILAVGGGLLLLFIVVLLTCCFKRKWQEKQQQDEEEFRLNHLHPSQPIQSKSKQTARGKPAPPIPQNEVPINQMPQAPSKTQTGTRNQKCVRPPPSLIDEDEQFPPLPQPRKKAYPPK